jgi:hypothetical protein
MMDGSVRALAVVAFVAFPLVARADASLSSTSDPSAVYGGAPVAPCGWPTTVSMEGSCTGTLVHPEVVVYAQHCGPGFASVRLGDSTNGTGRSVPTEFCRVYQGGGPGTGRDVAVCKLAEPVLDVEIVPPLMGCEASILQQGREVVIVGFGETDDGNYGIKYEATAEFGFISDANEAFLGGGGVDSCQGDSGGPVYVRLPSSDGGDDAWRVFGITSYGNGCGGGGYYSLMHISMEWIEEQVGIDVTPCHDADGTWAPGPGCTEFPMDPAGAGGSWSDGCDPGPLGGAAAVCGAAFDPSTDPDPPTVIVSAPMDLQRFDSVGGQASVDIVVDANDGTGYGVASVELLIDGESFPNGVRMTPPWEWNAGFPMGTYTLSARATDLVGNVGESVPIVIGVDEDPEPLPMADTSGGSGESGSDSGGDDEGDDGTGTLPQDTSSRGGTDGCGCAQRRSSRVAMLSFFLLCCVRIRRAR